ncbi:hypothetical protein BJ546DRAFT_1003570 [Cryomyces antarcticus]
MARKDPSKLRYPQKAHATFTAEEAKERERQKQREKRSRRRSERAREAAQDAAPEPRSSSIGRRIDEPESIGAASSLQDLQHGAGHAERTGRDIVFNPGVGETDGQRPERRCSGSPTSARSPPRTTVSTTEKDASLIGRRVTRSQTRLQLSVEKATPSPSLQRLPSPTLSPPSSSDGSTLFVERRPIVLSDHIMRRNHIMSQGREKMTQVR